MQLVFDAERKTLIITISLAARFFTEWENCHHRQQICCKTLARSSLASLVLACKSRKLTFPKFTKRLKKLTRLSILLFKFLRFTKVPSALNPVLQVPKVHERSKVPSGLNPQTSKSSLGSQSGPPNVHSVLNPVLQKFPQLSILLSRFLRSTNVL
jgi:hypothetical protein